MITGCRHKPVILHRNELHGSPSSIVFKSSRTELVDDGDPIVRAKVIISIDQTCRTTKVPLSVEDGRSGAGSYLIPDRYAVLNINDACFQGSTIPSSYLQQFLNRIVGKVCASLIGKVVETVEPWTHFFIEYF